MSDSEWGWVKMWRSSKHLPYWVVVAFIFLHFCPKDFACHMWIKRLMSETFKVLTFGFNAMQVVQCPPINSAKVANPVIATLSFTFPSRLPTKKYSVKKLLMELIWFTHYMISLFTMDSMQPNIMLLSIKNGLGVWLLGSKVHCQCGIKREGIHGPPVYNTLLLLLHTSVKLPDLVLTFLHPNGQHNTNCCQ